MITLICFCMAINIDGGYETPIVGFKDISHGVNVGIGLETKVAFFDMAPGLRMDYYPGDNTRYSIMNYELITAAYKASWVVSPYIGFGGSYLKRSLTDNAEIGYAFIYRGGGQLKISKSPVNIFLRLLYNGLTDFKSYGGFIGYQIGFSYNFGGYEQHEY